jgi:hypothetical protein
MLGLIWPKARTHLILASTFNASPWVSVEPSRVWNSELERIGVVCLDESKRVEA